MQIKVFGALLISAFVVSGCVQPPQNEQERAARLAVSSQFAAQRCMAQIGGYQAARELRANADKQMATARALGATDEVIAKARQDVETVFSTAAAFTSNNEACNTLVGQLAWHAGS